VTWVSRIVRLGYLAKGLIYTLIGVLGMRVAFGMRGARLSDPTGILMQILRQPFGHWPSRPSTAGCSRPPAADCSASGCISSLTRDTRSSP